MPELFKDKYRIASARLPNRNYAENSMNFITICTANRECFFGDIMETTVETQCIASLQKTLQYKMQLNDLRPMTEMEWLKTKVLRPDMNLELKEYVIMPNHFHGIIFIGENEYNSVVQRKDAMHSVSTTTVNNNDPTNDKKNKFGPQSKNLASIVRGFKSAVTTFARKIVFHLIGKLVFMIILFATMRNIFELLITLKVTPINGRRISSS